jgi:hypothetical protein
MNLSAKIVIVPLEQVGCWLRDEAGVWGRASSP